MRKQERKEKRNKDEWKETGKTKMKKELLKLLNRCKKYRNKSVQLTTTSIINEERIAEQV